MVPRCYRLSIFHTNHTSSQARSLQYLSVSVPYWLDGLPSSRVVSGVSLSVLVVSACEHGPASHFQAYVVHAPMVPGCERPKLLHAPEPLPKGRKDRVLVNELEYDNKVIRCQEAD